ncbi:MAG: hypothetical protein ACE5DX_01885 [Candidatus Dojkabacteria bacterium]
MSFVIDCDLVNLARVSQYIIESDKGTGEDLV